MYIYIYISGRASKGSLLSNSIAPFIIAFPFNAMRFLNNVLSLFLPFNLWKVVSVSSTERLYYQRRSRCIVNHYHLTSSSLKWLYVCLIVQLVFPLGWLFSWWVVFQKWVIHKNWCRSDRLTKSSFAFFSRYLIAFKRGYQNMNKCSAPFRWTPTQVPSLVLFVFSILYLNLASFLFVTRFLRLLNRPRLNLILRNLPLQPELALELVEHLRSFLNLSLVSDTHFLYALYIHRQTWTRHINRCMNIRLLIALLPAFDQTRCILCTFRK